jgi:hypothetical protein
MKKYIAFDNGGKTPDRFTIINKETADVFGLSEDPGSSNGISRLCGNCAEHLIIMGGTGWRQRMPAKKLIQAEVENYINNAKLDPDWLGREIDFMKLPEAVRSVILALEASDDSNRLSQSPMLHIA